MNHRHLTQDERQQLLKLVEDAGPIEVLRSLAGIVAFAQPYSEHIGTIRYTINKVANDIDRRR